MPAELNLAGKRINRRSGFPHDTNAKGIEDTGQRHPQNGQRIWRFECLLNGPGCTTAGVLTPTPGNVVRKDSSVYLGIRYQTEQVERFRKLLDGEMLPAPHTDSEGTFYPWPLVKKHFPLVHAYYQKVEHMPVRGKAIQWPDGYCTRKWPKPHGWLLTDLERFNRYLESPEHGTGHPMSTAGQPTDAPPIAGAHPTGQVAGTSTPGGLPLDPCPTRNESMSGDYMKQHAEATYLGTRKALEEQNKVISREALIAGLSGRGRECVEFLKTHWPRCFTAPKMASHPEFLHSADTVRQVLAPNGFWGIWCDA